MSCSEQSCGNGLLDYWKGILECWNGLLEWNMITRLFTIALECITSHSLLFSSVLMSPIMVLVKVLTR